MNSESEWNTRDEHASDGNFRTRSIATSPRNRSDARKTTKMVTSRETNNVPGERCAPAFKKENRGTSELPRATRREKVATRFFTGETFSLNFSVVLSRAFSLDRRLQRFRDPR